MAPVARHVQLTTGGKLPTIGLGVYQTSPGPTTQNAVLSALKLGYQHVDTAQFYNNEKDVGTALAKYKAEGGEEDIWVTTKVWLSNWGYDRTRSSVQQSLEKLGLSSVHLVLLHAPGESATRAETWRALEDLHKEGVVKNIGVSNFGVHHLEKLSETATVTPAVNQIELSPFLQRKELVAYCRQKGIVVEAYSPLMKGQRLEDPPIAAIASKHNVTPAQTVLRWSLQSGFVPLPKSVTPFRQKTNLDVYSFELDDEDIEALNALDAGYVTGWDPINDHEL